MLEINWKKIRKDSGLTQQEFANRVGLMQQTYCNYEIGKTSPNFDTTVDILTVAGYELKLVKLEKGE